MCGIYDDRNLYTGNTEMKIVKRNAWIEEKTNQNDDWEFEKRTNELLKTNIGNKI